MPSRPAHSLWSRSALVLAASCLCAATALAQVAPDKDAASTATRKEVPDAKIERVHVEDDSTRIDEVKFGGRTESITVSPKSGLPAYEVIPADAGRSGKDSRDAANGNAGQRVWNVLKF